MRKMSLAAVRVNAGLTQRELAAKAGFGLNSVVSWEKGRKPITEADLQKYCEVCGCRTTDVSCKVLILADA